MPLNPEQVALSFAERLAAVCARELEGVVAAILHGSLVLGDFRPGRSDIDLLVVVEGPLADAELDRLESTVRELQHDVPCRVDLRVVTREAATVPARAPAMEAYVHLRPGSPPEVERRVAGEPDLVPEFSMVRAHGRVLTGAAARLIIAPVPDGWVLEEGLGHIARWLGLTDDAAHAELMVLTTCRIWRFGVETVHCSKSDAGRWALARDPSLTAVEEALRQRTVEPGTPIREAGIRPVLAIVLGELRRIDPID